MLTVILAGLLVFLGYAAAGVAGLVPWHATGSSTVASSAWLVVAAAALLLGVRRVSSPDFASSRRNAHRTPVRADVEVDGAPGVLIDASVGGASVLVPDRITAVGGVVRLVLPGAAELPLRVVRQTRQEDCTLLALQVAEEDWAALRDLSLWLFHTPGDAVPGLPAGVPAVAVVHQSWTDAPPSPAELQERRAA